MSIPVSVHQDTGTDSESDEAELPHKLVNSQLELVIILLRLYSEVCALTRTTLQFVLVSGVRRLYHKVQCSGVASTQKRFKSWL